MSQETFPSPFDWMRDALTKMESLGNEYGGEFLKKPETVQAVQRTLTASLALQQARVDAMAKILAAMEMPSRSEVEALNLRLGNVEASLARIEQHLGITVKANADKPRPTRTRKPPSKE